MIHFDVRGGKTHLMINGNLEEILSESAFMIFTIYRELLKKNARVAEVYRDFFENNGEMIFNPEEASKEELESAERMGEIDELLETLLEKLKSKRESEEN